MWRRRRRRENNKKKSYGNESHGELEQIVSFSKAIARTIARSKTARFNFEHIIDST